MFSKKNKEGKLQLLKSEVTNYKTQMTTLNQEKEYLKTLLFDQKNQLNTTIYNKEKEIINLNENIKTLNKDIKELKDINKKLHLDIENINKDINIFKKKSNEKLLDYYICKVCLDKPINCILEPCMHFCICETCIENLPTKQCPMCRKKCNFYNKIYIS